YRGLYALDPVSRELYREVYSRDALLELVRRDLPGFPEDRVHAVNHHLAHAASAAFTSGWDECLVAVLDGMGEAHSASVSREGGEARERYLATRGFLTKHLGPARSPEDDIADVHRDVAAALQECLDRALLHVCGHFGAATGQRRLALAGGVALNCTANGRLLQAGLFDEIYVQPAAGDDGSALGAALWR